MIGDSLRPIYPPEALPEAGEKDQRVAALQTLMPDLFPSRRPAEGWGPEVVERVGQDLERYRQEVSQLLAGASVSDAELPSYASRLVSLYNFIAESYQPNDYRRHRYLRALMAAFDNQEKVQAAEDFMKQWEARKFSSLAYHGEEKRRQEHDLRHTLNLLAADESERKPSERMTTAQLADHFNACLDMYASIYTKLHDNRQIHRYWNANIATSVSVGAKEMALKHRDADTIRWMTKLFKAVVDYRAPREEQDRMWIFFLTVLDFGKKYGLRKEVVQAFEQELWPRMKKAPTDQEFSREFYPRAEKFSESLREKADSMIEPKEPAPRPPTVVEEEPKRPMAPEEARQVLEELDRRLAESARGERETVELTEREVEALHAHLNQVQIVSPPQPARVLHPTQAKTPAPPEGNPQTVRELLELMQRIFAYYPDSSPRVQAIHRTSAAFFGTPEGQKLNEGNIRAALEQEKDLVLLIARLVTREDPHGLPGAAYSTVLDLISIAAPPAPVPPTPPAPPAPSWRDRLGAFFGSKR